MDQNLKLTTTEFDQYIPSTSNCEDSPLKDPTSYQQLIGRLLYLTTTRSDIAFAVQSLSQFMHSPKKIHMEAAMRLVKYVKHASGLDILMSTTGDDLLKVYCDIDWGACINNRRSITGYLVHYGNSPILWKSKKQATVSRSSAEAEYRAMASSVAETIWMTGLFKELGVEIKVPVSLFFDSKSTLQIATNPVFHERTKHIDIDCHFTREKIQEGLIVTAYLPSTEQPADLFTKGLGRSLHMHLMSKLGMKNIFIASSLRGSMKEIKKCVDVP